MQVFGGASRGPTEGSKKASAAGDKAIGDELSFEEKIGSNRVPWRTLNGAFPCRLRKRRNTVMLSQQGAAPSPHPLVGVPFWVAQRSHPCSLAPPKMLSLSLLCPEDPPISPSHVSTQQAGSSVL